jgi:CheY-like chemotaxis protein
MKKVLLIGVANDNLRDLNEYLHQFFRVTLCTETTQNVPSILKVVEPECVVVLIEGVYDVDTSIFQIITEKYPKLPVLTIGTSGEFRNFVSYFKANSFENLLRPLSKEDVMLAICRRLDITPAQLMGDPDTSSPVDYRKHVLIVDDNAMTLRTLKSMLDTRYRVSLANSGMKALTSIGKDRPDVIVLDYEMPVVNGQQTLEMIRADDEICDIPVIFLTGVNDKNHIESVIKLRPSGYLLKPADQFKLVEAIDNALA